MKTDPTNDYVSRTSQLMTNLLLNALGARGGTRVMSGLPSGAIHLPEQKLIIAATPCDPPLFETAMQQAARDANADVILVHHGLFPETLNHVTFSVLIHVGSEPILLTDMLLYHHAEDGYWLVPGHPAPFIALEPDGLLVAFEPPFITYAERNAGVCAGAAQIVRATQSVGAC